MSHKQRTQRGDRAGWPPAKRLAVSALAWAAGTEHPPYRMRRAVIRALAGKRLTGHSGRRPEERSTAQ